MPGGDYLILVGMGGFFLIMGIALVARGMVGGKSDYASMSTGLDVKEYIEREPGRSEALKVGGGIAIALGLFLVMLTVGFWLWG